MSLYKLAGLILPCSFGCYSWCDCHQHLCSYDLTRYRIATTTTTTTTTITTTTTTTTMWQIGYLSVETTFASAVQSNSLYR